MFIFILKTGYRIRVKKKVNVSVILVDVFCNIFLFHVSAWMLRL